MKFYSWVRSISGILRGHLVLCVATVNALLMLIFIIDMTLRVRCMMSERQVEQATTLAKSLSTSTPGWIAAADISGLQEMIDMQRLYPDLIYAMVTDKQGHILAHTDPSKQGLYLLDLPSNFDKIITSNTNDLIDIMVPAIIDNRHVGWARVGVKQPAASNKLTQITRNGIFYIIIAILNGALIAWFFGSRVSERLFAVQQIITEIRTNNRLTGNRLPDSMIQGQDEASTLAREFNAMLDTLKISEAELHTSEEKYRNIVNTANEGIWMIDADLKTTFLNTKMAEMLGLTTEEMNLRPFTDFIPKEELADFATKIENRRHGLSESYERQFQHKNGHTIWTLVSASPLFDAEHHYCGSFGMITDITERKKLEKQVLKFNQELEKQVADRTAELEFANQELESFAYSTAHDLRTPLRSIDGFSKILLEDYSNQLDADGKRYLTVLRNSSQRMGQLIDDILHLSRITLTPLHALPVNLSALADEVGAALKNSELERHVELTIQPGCMTIADLNLMRIVLENVLGNAWKFTQNQPTPKIEFGMELHENRPVYFVRDNGVGFDMQYVSKLFGAFQRLHPVHEFPGNGIGLATVQRIIHRHGGKIWIEGKINEGATVYFTLPHTETS